MRKWLAKRRAAGLCIGCGKSVKNSGRRQCGPCREKNHQKLLRCTRGVTLTMKEMAGRHGNCQICFIPASEQRERKTNARVLDCDHDHKTGEFRGWICHRCNSVLAATGDDSSLLLAMADYLLKIKRNVPFWWQEAHYQIEQAAKWLKLGNLAKIR